MLHRDQSRNVEGNADLLPAGQILASHRPLLLTMQIPPSECFRARAGPSCPKGLSCSWFLFRGELASASSFSGRFRVRSPSHPLGWPRTFLFLVYFSWGAGFRQLLLRTLPRPGPELPPWVTRDFRFPVFFLFRELNNALLRTCPSLLRRYHTALQNLGLRQTEQKSKRR